jgi:hypothetical protein
LMQRNFLTILKNFEWRWFLMVFWLFQPVLFQCSLQCFEGILRENGVIIESSFNRSCNPQFKAFNLNLFPIKSSTFWLASSLHCWKVFSWAVKTWQDLGHGSLVT